MSELFLLDSRAPEMYVNFYKREGINVSMEFLLCADKQLRISFEKLTAIRINKHICVNPPWIVTFNYQSDIISQFSQNIFVNHETILGVLIKWKSKSGIIYKLEDKDIDCDDVEFWFENLDATLVHKYLYPKVSLPFKLKDLTYELIVTRINMDCTLEMGLKEGVAIENIINQIDDFIADFNHQSEKKDRKDGVIHNWKRNTEQKKLVYELDLGSTGVVFLKKLLNHLSKLNAFKKVELC
jgi:hypothetical protein